MASAVLSDGSAVYTPGLSERRSGASKFYHTDALGSTRGITNSSQTATDSILYDAFGMTVARTGTTPTPFGFVGCADYQTDTDTGLMLLGHRYYDPSIGRFITQDPIGAGENWYAYVKNNPLVGTDPKGLQSSLTNPLNQVEAYEAGLDADAAGGGSYPPGYDPPTGTFNPPGGTGGTGYTAPPTWGTSPGGISTPPPPPGWGTSPGGVYVPPGTVPPVAPTPPPVAPGPGHGLIIAIGIILHDFFVDGIKGKIFDRIWDGIGRIFGPGPAVPRQPEPPAGPVNGSPPRARGPGGIYGIPAE